MISWWYLGCLGSSQRRHYISFIDFDCPPNGWDWKLGPGVCPEGSKKPTQYWCTLLLFPFYSSVSTSIDPGWRMLPYIALSPTQLLASKTLAVQARRRALQVDVVWEPLLPPWTMPQQLLWHSVAPTKIYLGIKVIHAASSFHVMGLLKQGSEVGLGGTDIEETGSWWGFSVVLGVWGSGPGLSWPWQGARTAHLYRLSSPPYLLHTASSTSSFLNPGSRGRMR